MDVAKASTADFRSPGPERIPDCHADTRLPVGSYRGHALPRQGPTGLRITRSYDGPHRSWLLGSADPPSSLDPGARTAWDQDVRKGGNEDSLSETTTGEIFAARVLRGERTAAVE